MRVEKPMLVIYIVTLNLLSAFLVVVSIFLTPKFTKQYGIYFIPISNFLDGITRILMVLSLLIISYGFIKLKRWGYWAMIAYNLFFLIVSIIFVLTKNSQLGNMGNSLIQSLLGLMITFPSKRYFIKKNKSS